MIEIGVLFVPARPASRTSNSPTANAMRYDGSGGERWKVDLAPAGVARALRLDRHVGERAHVPRAPQRELPRRLAVGLVEARQHAARVHRLELRDRIPAGRLPAGGRGRSAPRARSFRCKRCDSLTSPAGSTLRERNPITSSLPGTTVAAMRFVLRRQDTRVASRTFRPFALSHTRSVGSSTRTGCRPCR